MTFVSQAQEGVFFLQVGLLTPTESGPIQISAGANTSFCESCSKSRGLMEETFSPAGEQAMLNLLLWHFKLPLEKCDKNQGKGNQPGRKRVLRLRSDNSIK